MNKFIIPIAVLCVTACNSSVKKEPAERVVVDTTLVIKDTLTTTNRSSKFIVDDTTQLDH